MSIDVGRIEAFKFLKDTACMNPRERKILAVLEGFQGMFGKQAGIKKFSAFVDRIKPLVRKIGLANWNRDIITDLGLAKAHRQQRISTLKTLIDKVKTNE